MTEQTRRGLLSWIPLLIIVCALANIIIHDPAPPSTLVTVSNRRPSANEQGELVRKFIDSSKPLLANNVSTRLGDVGVVPQNATSMTLRVPRGEDMDDIVDPMVRAAEAGELLDVVHVECLTTKGVLNIEVFPKSWGSRGAERFLALVGAGLFSTPVALHRAVKNFIIQFGTPGDGGNWSQAHKGQFSSIPDDPQWLPLGALCGEKRKWKRARCKRHRKGFMSFAGGGKNSRRIEMFVSLSDTGHGGDVSCTDANFVACENCC